MLLRSSIVVLVVSIIVVVGVSANSVDIDNRLDLSKITAVGTFNFRRTLRTLKEAMAAKQVATGCGNSIGEIFPADDTLQRRRTRRRRRRRRRHWVLEKEKKKFILLFFFFGKEIETDRER